MMKTKPTKHALILIVLAIASSLLYGWLLSLGPSYSLEVDVADRPLLLVIGIYVFASLLSLIALQTAIKMPSTRWLIGFVVVTSFWFRTLLLPTPPFQEIDLYRYLWDGAMTANRFDPYAVTPQQIVDQLDQERELSNLNPLQRRIEVIAACPALDPILRTIHYAELPSPYPPVSQAVFALSHLTESTDWSEGAHIRWLKGWLTLFDIATLLLLFRLLWRTGLPMGWSIAYGWCPLVLKEFAGSGHLDSIAIFFTTAALVAVIEAFSSHNEQATNKRAKAFCLFAATLLALGVGAKLYPIILAPLLAITFLRRFGWRTALAGTIVFVSVVTLTLLPMLLPVASSDEGRLPQDTPPLNSLAIELPAPPDAIVNDKTKGLSAFLKQWEMNDLLFMIVYENLLSQHEIPSEQRPWFDVTPYTWSEGSWGEERRAFLLTRVLTLVIFAAMAMALAMRASRAETNSSDWLRAAFLTIAWFWLLAPTQNPWYWCWALPLLPFARSAAWRWFAVVLFAYYIRFWLEAHATEVGFLGTHYDGKYFFYYVVSWLEHGPLLAWLAWESIFATVRPNVPSLTDLASDKV